MSSSNRTVAGVACGIGAGACWGLVFLAPELAREFGPLQLAAGRYVAYGVLSAVLLAPHWKALVGRLGRREWIGLNWLSLLGNTLYYVLLASAVQLGGIAMTSLVIGFLPVAVTILGVRETNAVSLRRMLPSLLLTAAGAMCIGWQTLGKADTGAAGTQAAGLLCAMGALVSWTAFAVGNRRWLAHLEDVPAKDWSLLIGVTTGAQAVFLIPLAMIFESTVHEAQGWARFALICAAIGLFSSVVGNALWNRMNRLLPLTLVGQMILFETLFALLYGFWWEARLPTGLELAAIILVVLSVLWCVSAHRVKDTASRDRRPVASDAPGKA